MTDLRRVGWVFFVTALTGEVQGADRELAAEMACRPDAGRLLCTIAVQAPRGEELRWSDARVVSAPPAARPLRSRVASAADQPERIVLGFVLVDAAGGDIEVVARAVSCPSAPRRGACRAQQAIVRFRVAGSVAPPERPH